MLLSRFQQDNLIEIGIDEAGRGSFWGPITAGAVMIPDEYAWTQKQQTLFMHLRDSKKISPKKREALAKDIREHVPDCSIGMVHAHEINEHGITWANKEAFRRAIGGLSIDESNCRLIIDGILGFEDWKGQQELIVEGDSKYLAIAAASILAKVEHDQWIQQYCTIHPEVNERYDLCKSKGYGTANHRDGIRIYGGHELHRNLYIQNWLPGAIPKPKSKKRTSEECIIKFN